MRIHLFGAVLAWDYLLAGWLRERGIDAHYYFNYKRSEADYPWWEDRSFDRANMPAWCHFHPFRLPYFYRAPLGAAGRAFVRSIDEGADLLVLIGDGAFLAHHFRTPYSVLSCGFEVEAAVPAPIDWRALAGRLTGGRELVNIQRQLNYRGVQRNLRAARSVISVMEFQVPTYLAQAGVRDNLKVLPMLYDCSRYAPAPDPALNARYAEQDVVFFLPTRHSYRTGTTNDKGADKVLRAFARFASATDARARLLLIRKGERLAESDAIITELGIAPLVEWLPQMPKDDLKHYYSLANVVVLDQFANEDTIPAPMHAAMRRFGARGAIFAEAMCTGAPVISNVGREWITRFDPRPFVWNACSEEEIVQALGEAAAIPIAERQARGRGNREWAFRHLDWRSVIDLFIRHFEEIVR